MREQLPHVLIVDDDRDIREPLAKYLGQNGYRISKAENAKVARQMLAGSSIDLVLLDVMMPGEDGLSLCSFIRATTKLPVILLTAKSEETDKIVGLEIGADDYITKPFSPRELLARMKALFRRISDGESVVSDANEGALSFASWVLNPNDMTLADEQGITHPLSTGEFKLLHALATHPRKVMSRDQLLDHTQGKDAALFDRSIDNHVSRLRRKIEDDPRNPKLIKTVWGGGYMFNAEVRRL